MEEFNEKIIKSLSRLTQIEVSDEEIPALLTSLSQVLCYFDELAEVDVSDLPAHVHMEQGIESFREDEVGDTLDRKEFLNNAPEHIGGMIRVPAVLSIPS